MSADQVVREPTMEEILMSIRRIISEEDRPAEAADVLQLAPAPVVAPKITLQPPSPPETLVAPPPPEPAPVVAEDPPAQLQIFEEPEMPSHSLDDELMIMEDAELDVAPEPAAYAPPVAEPRPDRRQRDPEAIVGAPAATKTADALGRLMSSMVVTTGNTLDDVVRQMLKPMLKEWLDANLPAIVEAEVEREIDRIRRLGR